VARPVRARSGANPARCRGRAGFAAACCWLLPGCVTVYEDAPLVAARTAVAELAVPQAIPLGAGPVDEHVRPLLELYQRVLERLEEAVGERDLPAVSALLDGYERAQLPEWLRDRLRGYRAIAHGLAFARHAATSATLRLVAAGGEGVPAAPALELASPPPLGEPLRLEFALPSSGEAARLGGRDEADPIGFAIAITIEDLYVDGGTRTHKNHGLLWADRTVELAGDAVFRQPIALEVPGGDAVQRTMHVRIDLMPGYVHVAGRRAPVLHTTVAATSFTQWPRGHEAIARAPLATLREAIRRGDAAHFPHVFLGASFTRGADRELALGLLIDLVRLGTEAQAAVAMAALRHLTGVTQALGDREAWLAWWQLRR